MRLRKRGSIFSYRFGNPIIAKPEVIVAIRRVVQNACRHEDVKASTRMVSARSASSAASRCSASTSRNW